MHVKTKYDLDKPTHKNCIISYYSSMKIMQLTRIHHCFAKMEKGGRAKTHDFKEYAVILPQLSHIIEKIPSTFI